MFGDAIGDVPYIAEPVVVGRGGFATVYRATDLQAGRPVAVKLLAVRTEDGNLRHFDRERESLARLSTHPNVVTLHRTGVTSGGVPYLVMEFASGGSLAERSRTEGPLPWNEAVGWVLPICRAIIHANEQGIRHRDVKPQNILISDHGEPLLSDFGIAGLTAGTETVTNKARLSLSYASPEQIDGRQLDDSTDVYSLGATLYTLLAGRPAFADTDGAGFLNTATRIVSERPPALDRSIPPDIADAVAAAMAKDPGNRPTMEEFRLALERKVTLTAPPPGDALPERTEEVGRPGGPLGGVMPAQLAGGDAPTRPAPWPPAAAPTDDQDRDGIQEERVGAALDHVSGRTRSLLAVGSLILVGLIAAGLAGRADDIDAADPSPPTSTISADRDGDGSVDTEDNCPALANPDQRDTDGDDVGDACDPDDDGDGVPDVSDNCALEPNEAQEDVDGDGLGAACDDFPDRDGDGIIDTNDPCIEEPGAPDTDGDGTPDACDETPRGVVAVAARVEIDRVAVLNQAYGDGEADLFGDLTVDGTTFDLPEIADQREIRPGNWLSDRVAIEPGSPLVRVRIRIRDEDRCFLCRDGLVDITPVPGANALQLVIDTETGAVDLASESWNRLETIATLTGSADGDLSGVIAQTGDDDSVHLASIELSVTLLRQPAR